MDNIKEYEVKITGSVKCTRETTIGMMLAHIENARDYFDITSTYWGGAIGLEFDNRFPDYVTRIARDIDIKYSVNQDSMYRGFVTPHEIDYGNKDDWCSEWPRWERDYSILTEPKPDWLSDEETQIRTWISSFRYMFHDALVSYVYAIGESKYDKKDSKIGGSVDTLRTIILDLADWKVQFREDEQRETRRMIERELGVEWADGKPFISVKE